MRTFLFAAGVAVGLTFSALIAAAWSGPTQSPPSGNVAPPINVGSTNQVKNGNLGVNGLAVFGNTLLDGTNADGNGDGVNSYLNFGSVAGASGYGIRDDNGTLQFSNEGGTWASIQSTVQQLVSSTTSSQWSNGTNGALYYDGGYVGVGNSNPQSPFTVANGGGVGIYGSWPTISLNNYWTSNNGWVNYSNGWSAVIQVDEGIGGLNFTTTQSGNAGTAPISTEAMHITPSGDVGIETTNAIYPLQVNGSIYASGSVYAGGTQQVYLCPVWLYTGGGAWASYGCIGQLTTQSTCTNVWYSGGTQSVSTSCTPINLYVN